MGIESRCPNGHRVRVKDRFAGKKAYCPECGATFRVPPADALPPQADARPMAHSLPTAEKLPMAVLVSLDAAHAATLPRALAVPVEPVASRTKPRAGAVDSKARPGRRDRAAPSKDRADEPAPVTTPVADTALPHAAPTRSWHAVIAEAVDLTWNVALPGGDPSEPLSAETLQEWLDSGGPTGNELVWRSDWPDWVPLRLVFPEHVPEANR